MSKSRPEPEATSTDQVGTAQTGAAAPGADGVSADAPGAGEAGADAADDVPEFTNRAARRAKGTSTGKPQSFAKGQSPVGRGAVQSPRQYGARRSG